MTKEKKKKAGRKTFRRLVRYLAAKKALVVLVQITLTATRFLTFWRQR